MMEKSKKTNEYWQEAADTKRCVILFLFQLWKTVAFIAAGIILAIIIYFVYHAVADGVVYEAYSEFYLDFATDERGDAYQYYNGYTWNDLLSTDMIAEGTLDALNDSTASASTIEQCSYAEILSDIRVLRVTHTTNDETRCLNLQKATEKSLEAFGDTIKEFNSIKTIKSVSPTRIYADNRLPQAILLGGLVGLIVSLLYFAFSCILDDSVRTPIDLFSFDTKVIGVEMCNEDDKITDKLNAVYGTTTKALEEDTNDEEVHLDILSLGKENGLNLSDYKDKKVILEIPYKAVSKRYLSLIIDRMASEEIDLAGMIITKADNKFYKLYL